MSKMLRSISTKKFLGACYCCNDPYGMASRAIEKRQVEEEVEQELQDMEEDEDEV